MEYIQTETVYSSFDLITTLCASEDMQGHLYQELRESKEGRQRALRISHTCHRVELIAEL
jgi:hypothetical protein